MKNEIVRRLEFIYSRGCLHRSSFHVVKCTTVHTVNALKVRGNILVDESCLLLTRPIALNATSVTSASEELPETSSLTVTSGWH